MKNGRRIAVAILLTICFQLLVHAQPNSNIQFLKKVGVPDSIYSNVLDESREIYIQIPESYNPEKNQKYPVVFILDGEVFLPTVSDVHDYYSGGFMPEMVLVGISNANNRIRDLTTSSIETKYGMPFNEKNGEAHNFITFIENELIPMCQSQGLGIISWSPMAMGILAGRILRVNIWDPSEQR